MKNAILLVALIGLAAPLVFENKAEAYSSNVGADPKNDDPSGLYGGYGDLETKQIVKSSTAGISDVTVARRVLSYGSEADGYTVTRKATRTVAGLGKLACISMDVIATGDTGYHRCITKGFVRLQYDASVYPIVAGIPMCVTSDGVVTGCTQIESSVNTGLVPLESAASGTGNYLRAIVNMK